MTLEENHFSIYNLKVLGNDINQKANHLSQGTDFSLPQILRNSTVSKTYSGDGLMERQMDGLPQEFLLMTYSRELL